MPLARLITAHADSAQALEQELRARGYTVEIVADDTCCADPADLTIRVELCAVGDALSMASSLANAENLPVFIAPGALTERVQVPQVEHPQVEHPQVRPAAQELLFEPDPGSWSDSEDLVEVERVPRDPAEPTPPPIHEPDPDPNPVEEPEQEPEPEHVSEEAVAPAFPQVGKIPITLQPAPIGRVSCNPEEPFMAVEVAGTGIRGDHLGELNNSVALSHVGGASLPLPGATAHPSPVDLSDQPRDPESMKDDVSVSAQSIELTSAHAPVSELEDLIAALEAVIPDLQAGHTHHEAESKAEASEPAQAPVALDELHEDLAAMASSSNEERSGDQLFMQEEPVSDWPIWRPPVAEELPAAVAATGPVQSDAARVQAAAGKLAATASNSSKAAWKVAAAAAAVVLVGALALSASLRHRSPLPAPIVDNAGVQDEPRDFSSGSFVPAKAASPETAVERPLRVTEQRPIHQAARRNRVSPDEGIAPDTVVRFDWKGNAVHHGASRKPELQQRASIRRRSGDIAEDTVVRYSNQSPSSSRQK